MFGILNSNVHNAWMRKVAVRLKNDYSYSKDIVYNTFPIPELTVEHKKNISVFVFSILVGGVFVGRCFYLELWFLSVVFAIYRVSSSPLAVPRSITGCFAQQNIGEVSEGRRG